MLLQYLVQREGQYRHHPSVADRPLQEPKPLSKAVVVVVFAAARPLCVGLCACVSACACVGVNGCVRLRCVSVPEAGVFTNQR